MEVSAGVSKAWSGGLDAFLRAELGWRPADTLSVFAFAEADRIGLQAGLGARVTF